MDWFRVEDRGYRGIFIRRSSDAPVLMSLFVVSVSIFPMNRLLDVTTPRYKDRQDGIRGPHPFV